MSHRLMSLLVLVLGLLFVALGCWALAGPHSFFTAFGTPPPYSRSLVHTLGTLQIGVGVALLAALTGRDAVTVVLSAAAVSAIAHAVMAVADHAGAAVWTWAAAVVIGLAAIYRLRLGPPSRT